MIGIIIKAFGQYYTVFYDNKRINCTLRGKIRRDKSLERFTEPIVVGDTVDFEIGSDGTGTIDHIHERANIFSRKDRGKSKEDIIASNIDQIVIIQAFKKPELNLRFVDRLLVRGEKENIPVILCVNKADLSTQDKIDYIYSYYKGCDFKILIVSAESAKGLDEFKTFIINKLSIFIGYSGVGKSTILNKLYPSLNLRTSEISASTNKGKHTTTNVEMIIMEDNTRIIDTPGLREFGLMDIELNQLADYFKDFRKYISKCSFQPCSHDHEPGCEVKRQVEKGAIFEDRYISYLNILYSLKEDYENRYK